LLIELNIINIGQVIYWYSDTILAIIIEGENKIWEDKNLYPPTIIETVTFAA
jgi:hypothetical protein